MVAKGKARIEGRKAEGRGDPKGVPELEVEQKGLKGAARFIQRGSRARGGELGEGKGWTAGQTKPLLLHFCPSGQTPTLYTRELPSCARLVHSLPPRLVSLPRNPSMLRRVVLSVRYFSSSLINGTVASLAGGLSRPVEGYVRMAFDESRHPKSWPHCLCLTRFKFRR